LDGLNYISEGNKQEKIRNMKGESLRERKRKENSEPPWETILRSLSPCCLTFAPELSFQEEESISL
jgi:hypothetical protein